MEWRECGEMQEALLGLTAGPPGALWKGAPVLPQDKVIGLWGLGSQGGVGVRQELPRRSAALLRDCQPLVVSALDCHLIPSSPAGQGLGFPPSTDEAHGK